MAPAGPMTLEGLGAAWARRWRVIVTCLTLGLLASAVAMVALPPSYTATAAILVSPLSPTAPGTASVQANMASERGVATSGEVLEAAVARLQAGDAAGIDVPVLREAVTVTVPTGSSMLHVAATTGDPERSARWSNALAEAYLSQRGEAAAVASRRIAQRLQDDIARVTAARAAASAADRSLYDQQLVRLWERQQDLLTAPADPGRIVTQAQTPTRASSPGRSAFVVGGGALGLLLGAALALVRDRRDPGMRHPGWVGHGADTPPVPRDAATQPGGHDAATRPAGHDAPALSEPSVSARRARAHQQGVSS